MHELSIVEGIFDLVDKQKKLHQFTRVLEVRIACGVYNCVSEDNLNFCLKTISEGTCLDSARITVIRLPERWSCSLCHCEFAREKKAVDPVCPQCSAVNVVPLLNSEIYLDKLEVE